MPPAAGLRRLARAIAEASPLKALAAVAAVSAALSGGVTYLDLAPRRGEPERPRPARTPVTRAPDAVPVVPGAPSPGPGSDAPDAPGEPVTPWVSVPAPAPGRPVVDVETAPPADKGPVPTDALPEIPAPGTAPDPHARPGSTAPAPASAPAADAHQSLPDVVERARGMLDHGDVASARMWLAMASDKGDREATFVLGQTYDPGMLREWGVMGMSSDVPKARELYRAAAAAGVAGAAERLATLDP